MARPLRLAIPDGWYHVFSRGLERWEIFADDRDRGHFLELLEVLPARYRIVIHAYALMGNHYHGIVQTPEANLSRGLQWLNGSQRMGVRARHSTIRLTTGRECGEVRTWSGP